MDNLVDEKTSLENIIEYSQLISRWAWLLTLVTILTGVIVYFYTMQLPRQYEASTMIQVSGGNDSVYSSAYYSNYEGQTLAQTYAKTMVTRTILEKVSDRIGYEVKGGITIKAEELQPLIELRVADTDPQRAADIANTLVKVFSEKLLEDQAAKYYGLKSNIENQISGIDKELEIINEKLAVLSIKFSDIEAQQRKNAALEAAGIAPTVKAEKDPADIVEQNQLQFSQSQYQTTRASLFLNLQQITLSEVQSTTTINQLDPAIPNPIPIRPQPMRSALFGALVGLAGTSVLIFLAAYLQDTVRNPEEITRRWGVPVLGVISTYNANQNPLIAISQPRSPTSEAFRSLRTNLQFSGVNKPLKTVVVTSASPNEGKTSIVSNLAAVVVQNGRNVVVVDSDMRRPRIHRLFSLSNRIGLADFFIKPDDNIDEIIKDTGLDGLQVITSGSLPPNPSELLSSEKMTIILDMLGQRFNSVFIDTPPLLAVTDALVLASRVDGVILVIDPHKTKRAAIKHAIEQLRRINANLIGVIINKVKLQNSAYYYNKGYYYGQLEDKILLSHQNGNVVTDKKNEEG